MQATADLLKFGPADVERFDHLEFPGVVPRTFLGALAVSALACPFEMLRRAFGMPFIASQYAARGAMGLLSWAGHRSFRAGVAHQFGEEAGWCLSLVTASQFHLPFYMSRTLPNSLALVVLLFGYGKWLGPPRTRARRLDGPAAGLFVMVVATVLFRCDILVLLAPIGISMLASREMQLLRGIMIGLCAGAAGLALTVAVDSYFWRRWLWPEGEVLFFNTVDNKSVSEGAKAHPPRRRHQRPRRPVPPHWC